MPIVILSIFLLLGLTAAFKKVSEWFQDNKGMNIIPPALIDMVAVLIFMFHYEGEKTEDTIWICVAIAIVLVIIVFNFIRYGLKNGALASLAELVFSVSAAILVAFLIAASSQKRKRKK